MWRQTAGDTEADDARTAVDFRTAFSDRSRQLCREVATVTAANDTHPRARSDSGFKSQAHNDDHVIPT
jgi:hypothetical protein